MCWQEHLLLELEQQNLKLTSNLKVVGDGCCSVVDGEGFGQTECVACSEQGIQTVAPYSN